jgi:hypothetical protein
MTALTIILLVVTMLNSVVLAAVVHQLGLLSLRVQPVPPMAFEEGPQPGDFLNIKDAPWRAPHVEAEPRAGYLIYFFSPTCTLCGQLLSGVRGLARRHVGDVHVMLATEAPEEQAGSYLARRKVDLPLISDERVLRANGIPGVPFTLALDRDGKVVLGGGVNTTEQIDELIEGLVLSDGHAEDRSLKETSDVNT